MAFGNDGSRRRFGNTGDPERFQGGKTPRPPWTDHARTALTALLKNAKLNDSTREMLEKFSQNRTPSNNQICTVYKIYCEKFHRPSKDYVIQAWQPELDAGGEQAGESPAAGKTAGRPRRQPPTKSEPAAGGSAGFGEDRWSEDSPEAESAGADNTEAED